MKPNPETIVYNNNLYLFYYHTEDASVVKDIEFSGMIMLYIDDIINKNMVDLLFIISNLKEFNKPICLITTYSLQEIPKYISRYFDYIECSKDIINIKNELSYLCIEGDLYEKGVDY